MATTKELLEKRAGIYKQAKDLLDKAEAENRDLTADEEQSYRSMMDDMNSLKARADRQHEMEEFASSVSEENPAKRAFDGKDDEYRAVDPYNSVAYRDAWSNYVLDGKDPAESLRAVEPFKGFQVGVDEKGGMFVPTTIEREILDFTEKHNVMRQLATVRSSTDNRQINFADQHVTAYWMLEGEKFTESEATFTKGFFNAYKIGALSKFTHESLQDMVGINAEQYIREDFGQAIADLEEAAYIAGDGDHKPKGFTVDCAVNGTTSGIVAASATAFTVDELMDLQHKHKANRRRVSKWLVSDSAALALRKLKDQDGQYIWQPSILEGQPDRLLGNAVYYADGVDAMASGNTPVWFGDFTKYRIQDRRGVYMQRLTELFATEGKVGILVYKRTDGHMLDPTAVQGLKLA